MPDRQTTVAARIDGREVKLCVPRSGTRFEDVRHERQVLFQLKRLLGREIAEHDERRLARTLVMVPCRAPTKKGGLKRRFAWGHLVTDQPEKRRAWRYVVIAADRRPAKAAAR